MKFSFANKRTPLKLTILFLLAAAFFLSVYLIFLRMPYSDIKASQVVDHELAMMLKDDVFHLSETIGPRGFHSYKALTDAANFIASDLEKNGMTVSRHNYKIKIEDIGKSYMAEGFSPEQVFTNISAELKGGEKPEEIIIVGAHYDSVCISKCKGADDNASGVAAVLALARKFAGKPQKKTIVFAAFVNEEPPFFQTDMMGSMVYAKKCVAENRKIAGVIVLDTVGYYSDEKNSQNYPPPLNYIYPSKGNFIAFLSNVRSVGFLRNCIYKFRKNSVLPSEGAAVPRFVPGSDWSDHWSFAQHGYKSLMITNTAMNRTPYYHTSKDTYDKLDYNSMSLLVTGIEKMLRELANE